jgi:hypothetical protein
MVTSMMMKRGGMSPTGSPPGYVFKKRDLQHHPRSSPNKKVKIVVASSRVHQMHSMHLMPSNSSLRSDDDTRSTFTRDNSQDMLLPKKVDSQAFANCNLNILKLSNHS